MRWLLPTLTRDEDQPEPWWQSMLALLAMGVMVTSLCLLMVGCFG